MKINVGFLGALAIVFITLKLVGVIDWSWWWVLAPLWAPFALALVLLLVVGTVAIFLKRVFHEKMDR